MTMHQPRPVKKKAIVLPANNIPRQVIKQIKPWLKRKEIIVLLGARQTGKTTILYQLINSFLISKKDPVFYFNLDLPHQLGFFSNPDSFIDLIVKQKRPVCIVIDEVQRLKNPGLFLKGIYDLNLPVKLIVSGSSSLEIKSKVQEALTGRKVVFNVYPFNLEESAKALGQDQVNQKVWEHFLIFGSYPSVIIEKNLKIKQAKLREIYQSYLERDIKSFFRIENEPAFNRLTTLLSSQIGNLINKSELSNALGIHLNTLDNYLFYLQETFVVDLITPFYRNKRKEILKNPKPYFLDLGFRNLAVRNFSDINFRSIPPTSAGGEERKESSKGGYSLGRSDGHRSENPFYFRQDKGQLLENFCYLELKRKLDPLVPIHFWRTKTQAEVDFVILPKLNQPIPIEVKAQRLNRPEISRSFRSFLKTYQPKRGYLLNLGYSGEKEYEGVKVYFLTISDFIKKREF